MDPGFRIGDDFYQFPQRFRIGDTVLVSEVTGLEFDVFAERIDAINTAIENGEDDHADVKALIGLIAVAVWQANPKWTRDRARQFVEALDMNGFTIEAGDDGPPGQQAEALLASPSPDVSGASTSSREPSLEEAHV